MKGNILLSRQLAIALVAAALLVSQLICPGASANFEAGLEAFNRGAYEKALPQFESAAKTGHAEAQYYLGIIFGEGRGRDTDLSRAVYWLSCADVSASGISGNARRLKARLLRGLSAADRAHASTAPRNCPTKPSREAEASEGEPFGAGESSARQPNAESGFAGFMQGVRDNGVTSLFMLPGEVIIAVGRETASLVGAKQAADAIDSSRLPGNDMIYLFIVIFSWLVIYKLVMRARSLWHKVSETAVTIEVGKEGRQALTNKRAGEQDKAAG